MFDTDGEAGRRREGLFEREDDLPRQPLVFAARIDTPSARSSHSSRQRLRKKRVRVRAPDCVVCTDRLYRRPRTARFNLDSINLKIAIRVSAWATLRQRRVR